MFTQIHGFGGVQEYSDRVAKLLKCISSGVKAYCYPTRDNFSLSAWGRNLTNKFYYVYGLNLNAFYQDYLTRSAPRT